MKRFFLSFCCIIFSLKVSSQIYFPYPTSSENPVWTSLNHAYASFPYPEEFSATHYGMWGDTMINSKNYSKLLWNYSDTEPSFNPATANFLGGVREDSLKKVWLYHPPSGSEILYYDFSLNTGDTFCYYSQPCGINCHAVTLVDSILIDGSYRRQIHFEYGGQTDIWVEGIGSVIAQFNESWCHIGNFDNTLNCFSKNNVHVYGTCDFPTSTSENNDAINSFNILQNPADQTLQFVLLNSPPADVEIRITSILGESLMRNHTMNCVDVSQLTNGIYILSINNGSSVHSQKFVVSHQ